jgi:hypothetical protein
MTVATGNSTMDAAMLLDEIGSFGERVTAQAPIVWFDDAIEEARLCCEALGEQLEDMIRRGVPAVRFLDGFAPLLLQAIDRLLACHVTRDARSKRFAGLVAFLVPCVRDDNRAALDWLAEVSRDERVTR